MDKELLNFMLCESEKLEQKIDLELEKLGEQKTKIYKMESSDKVLSRLKNNINDMIETLSKINKEDNKNRFTISLLAHQIIELSSKVLYYITHNKIHKGDNAWNTHQFIKLDGEYISMSYLFLKNILNESISVKYLEEVFYYKDKYAINDNLILYKNNDSDIEVNKKLKITFAEIDLEEIKFISNLFYLVVNKMLDSYLGIQKSDYSSGNIKIKDEIFIYREKKICPESLNFPIYYDKNNKLLLDYYGFEVDSNSIVEKKLMSFLQNFKMPVLKEMYLDKTDQEYITIIKICVIQIENLNCIAKRLDNLLRTKKFTNVVKSLRDREKQTYFYYLDDLYNFYNIELEKIMLAEDEQLKVSKIKTLLYICLNNRANAEKFFNEYNEFVLEIKKDINLHEINLECELENLLYEFSRIFTYLNKYFVDKGFKYILDESSNQKGYKSKYMEIENE